MKLRDVRSGAPSISGRSQSSPLDSIEAGTAPSSQANDTIQSDPATPPALTLEPFPGGNSYQFCSRLYWELETPGEFHLRIAYNSSRGVYFRIDAKIPTSSGFITAYIVWLPKHIEELEFIKWATPSKYLLLKFRLNLPPSLMAPTEWAQHISDLQDMKRLFTLCQSRKIFLQVSYSARDLERINWIIQGVQSRRLGSHDICPSFLGDSGKTFVVADDFPCSRSPSPDSSESSLSGPSSDTSSLKRSFHGSETNPKRRALEPLLHDIMSVLQEQSRDIRALREQGADSDARWRKAQKDVIHAFSRNLEDFRKEQVQAVCRSGEAEKQRLEDDAAAQKQRIEDGAAAQKQQVEDHIAAEKRKLDDRGEQEKARIDARRQQDVTRIEAYRQKEVARIEAHQKEQVEMMNCMSKAIAFKADLGRVED
ncbi:hypothetical protein ACQKWADRAFT_315377 [Trichoderma austrokoningii]